MIAYVLDASVAAKWYLPRGESLVEESLRLLNGFTSDQTRLAVPDLFWPEMGSIFWKAVCGNPDPFIFPSNVTLLSAAEECLHNCHPLPVHRVRLHLRCAGGRLRPPTGHRRRAPCQCPGRPLPRPLVGLRVAYATFFRYVRASSM